MDDTTAWAAKAVVLEERIRSFAGKGQWVDARGYVRAWGEALTHAGGKSGNDGQLKHELLILGSASALDELRRELSREGGMFGVRMSSAAHLIARVTGLEGASMIMRSPRHKRLIPVGGYSMRDGASFAELHAYPQSGLARRLFEAGSMETGVRNDLASPRMTANITRYQDDCVYAGAARGFTDMGVVAFVFGLQPKGTPITRYAEYIFALLFSFWSSHFPWMLTAATSATPPGKASATVTEYAQALHNAPYQKIAPETAICFERPVSISAELITPTPVRLSHALLSDVPLELKSRAIEGHRAIERIMR